jgi:hypothetical protein
VKGPEQPGSNLRFLRALRVNPGFWPHRRAAYTVLLTLRS